MQNESRRARSSGNRFADYKVRRRERSRAGDAAAITANEPTKRHRTRSIREVLGAFWNLARGHHTRLGLALVTLSVSTVIGMVLPVSTKVVMDYVWAETPGPEALAAKLEGIADIPRYADGTPDRFAMLWLIGLSMITLTMLSVVIAMWGRWQATRITKRLQVSFRRTLFDHAVRLPLERVQALKSGGIASILREDAGGVGELPNDSPEPFRALAVLHRGLVDGSGLRAVEVQVAEPAPSLGLRVGGGHAGGDELFHPFLDVKGEFLLDLAAGAATGKRQTEGPTRLAPAIERVGHRPAPPSAAITRPMARV